MREEMSQHLRNAVYFSINIKKRLRNQTSKFLKDPPSNASCFLFRIPSKFLGFCLPLALAPSRYYSFALSVNGVIAPPWNSSLLGFLVLWPRSHFYGSPNGEPQETTRRRPPTVFFPAPRLPSRCRAIPSLQKDQAFFRTGRLLSNHAIDAGG